MSCNAECPHVVIKMFEAFTNCEKNGFSKPLLNST